MKENGNNKNIITIISIILSICCAIFIIAFILINIFIKESGLFLSDWLLLGGSIFTFAGTITLAIVTNLQNNKLIAQNESLQKINKDQFRLSNQDKYPLFNVEIAKFDKSVLIGEIDFSKWQNGFNQIVDKTSSFAGTFQIDIDARNPNITTKDNYQYYIVILCKNLSNAIVNDFDIYKIDIAEPFNNSHNLKWNFQGIWKNNDTIAIEIRFVHNNKKAFDEEKWINFSLKIKQKTIAGYENYESIRISQLGILDMSKMEIVSENKL